MDLQESLAQAIERGTGLEITVSYLSPENKLGLVPTPGSHVIESDFAGNQHWQYNYAITIATKSAREAKNKLFAISNFLENLTDLESLDNSFEFEDIDVSSAPSELEQDEQGTVMYELDIAVFVFIRRK